MFTSFLLEMRRAVRGLWDCRFDDGLRDRRADRGILLIPDVWAWLTLRYIPNDSVGIVEKLWSRERLGAGRPDHRPERRGRLSGRPAPRRPPLRLLALAVCRAQGAAGHDSEGKIGYVYARDGEPLPPSQTLGRVVDVQQLPGRRARS